MIRTKADYEKISKWLDDFQVLTFSYKNRKEDGILPVHLQQKLEEKYGDLLGQDIDEVKSKVIKMITLELESVSHKLKGCDFKTSVSYKKLVDQILTRLDAPHFEKVEASDIASEFASIVEHGPRIGLTPVLMLGRRHNPIFTDLLSELNKEELDFRLIETYLNKLFVIDYTMSLLKELDNEVELNEDINETEPLGLHVY